jgi:AcrR family transcriptional regulator
VTHPVNVKRRYDASGRRDHAAERRKAVLREAHRLFLERGFAGTTVAAVASAAQVAAQTIYKNFGGKAGLVRVLHEEALRGAGAVSAEDRSDALRSDAGADAVVRGWSRLAAEVAPRVSPIQLLVRDAALVDPSLRDLLAELDESRHRRMADNAGFLRAAGYLRPDVSVEQAADLLWSTSSPEMFELLVRRRGWSIEEYAGWVHRTISDGLLDRSETKRRA